jgi:hypothetical protein
MDPLVEEIGTCVAKFRVDEGERTFSAFQPTTLNIYACYESEVQ